MGLVPFSFLFFFIMSVASKLITEALLGEDGVTILVDGQSYYVESPTIERIVGAAKYLHHVEDCKSLEDILNIMSNLENACKALSFFIQGDESLSAKLAKGKPNEIIIGLKAAYSLISIKDFYELSTLAKSVAKMVANPRP